MIGFPLRLGRMSRRFREEVRGMGAVEFALIAPALLMLYVGGVDVSLAVTMHRKVKHAASTMNDLVTRNKTMTVKEIEGVFDMGDAIVQPRANALDMSKLTAVSVDASGAAKVVWSQARNGAADAKGASVTLPADLSGLRDTHLIKSETQYRYVPFGGFGLVDPIEMKKTIYAMARVGNGVKCEDCK